MAETLDAEDGSAARLLLLTCEQILRAQAIAYRSDTDPNRICRDVQERVKGDDLVDFSTPDVHVIGNRIRKLGRDRPDVAANAPEVVEEPRPVFRKLGEDRRQLENVHRSILRLGLCPKS